MCAKNLSDVVTKDHLTLHAQHQRGKAIVVCVCIYIRRAKRASTYS